jgi:hypothetical protein
VLTTGNPPVTLGTEDCMYTNRFILAFALVMLAAHGAAAQSSASRPTPGERAAALITQADEIVVIGQFLEKARLYHDAAGLLPGDDPRLPILLTQAAVTYYYAGHLKRAEVLLRRAGRAADAQKNELVAADAYSKLLLLAVETNNATTARFSMDRLARLAASPTLPEAERSAILRRISPLKPISSR